MTFSPKVKQAIWDRASGGCERKLPNGKRCFAPIAHLHHLVAKKMGGRKGQMKELINDYRNGMGVCYECHESVDSWNEDAADLIPDKEFREGLRQWHK